MKIKTTLDLELPVFPNFLTVKGIQPSTLDDAFAMSETKGKLQIDVSQLDEEALDNFTRAWSVGFKEHVKNRKEGKK